MPFSTHRATMASAGGAVVTKSGERDITFPSQKASFASTDTHKLEAGLSHCGNAPHGSSGAQLGHSVILSVSKTKLTAWPLVGKCEQILFKAFGMSQGCGREVEKAICTHFMPPLTVHMCRITGLCVLRLDAAQHNRHSQQQRKATKQTK